MKYYILLLPAVVLLATQLHAQTNETFTGPYLGQDPPGMVSKVFALGFISTDAGELNSVLSPDGNEFYFSRRGIPGQPSALMVSKRVNDIWTVPEKLEISGAYSDIDLYITADGKSLVFCSTRPHEEGGDERSEHDFWVSARIWNAWAEPKPFAHEAISEYEDFYPVLTAKGNLYFNSQRGGQRGNNIFCSEYMDGEYTEAIKLPGPINSDDWEFDAYLTQDEKMIVFSSTRPGGYGGADIYVSRKGSDGNWTEPRNLGPSVNSASYEYGASISPDGKFLFYTSSRNGSEDIFWISADVLSNKSADASPPEVIDYGKIFMNHLMKNWDDIHDVIMRYHYEDPWLKGKALINMTWNHGRLEDAEVLENTTGYPAFGMDLISAMKAWKINEITDSWSSAIPIKTSIKGSEDPDFDEYGILTGKILDEDGKPLSGAGLVLVSTDNTSIKSKALHTNREGIFIETLILPGTYQLSCNLKGYEPVTIEDILIEKGKHCKQDISIK